MRLFVLVIVAAAGIAAQDSLSRQMAAVAKQKQSLESPGQWGQRQQQAASRQIAVAARQHHDAPWVIVAAEGGPSAAGSFDPDCRSLEQEDAKLRFKSEEEQNGLPAGLLEAVARQESALYPCAVSRAGALGLMQLMPATATELGVENPLDPWQSLQGGGQFLKQLLDRYGGDLSLALGAYNAGPSRVDFYGGVPPIPETQNYVGSVLTKMRQITASESQVKP
jgi:soluble lytic murein transglycosylase-like protein